MKKTKKLDMWTVLSFVILLCYAVFLLYPMLNLLRQSVVTIDGAFTLEYFQKFFGKSYYLITLWNSFKVSRAPSPNRRSVFILKLFISQPSSPSTGIQWDKGFASCHQRRKIKRGSVNKARPRPVPSASPPTHRVRRSCSRTS